MFKKFWWAIWERKTCDSGGHNADKSYLDKKVYIKNNGCSNETSLKWHSYKKEQNTRFERYQRTVFGALVQNTNK